MNGTILNLQNYAVHDGPGIRTLVFMKGCPLRCAWCCNPESQSAVKQLRYFSFRCKGCLRCVEHCPTASVSHWNGEVRRTFDECNACLAKNCIDTCNHDAVSVSGREISVADLTKIIALDIPFYRNSGGGVTFSGGEPMMQAAFLLEVLKECKKLEIHTVVETCGWADRKAWQNILPFTDLFLFDLKIIDPDQHLYHTGQPVAPILENLAFLASEKADIIIRFPLIPGITDTSQNLAAIAEIMDQLKLDRICLEPYHSLGREKYDEHGMAYKLDYIQQYDHLQVSAFRDFFRGRNILCEMA
ncbi:MAG: glycyl-radical enzyme activating protein [Bacteroidales bacterium]